jgi:hypothetical protein
VSETKPTSSENMATSNHPPLSPTPLIGAGADRVAAIDRDIARRRRRRRRSVGFGLLLALAAAIALLPRILSLPAARASILARANRSLEGQGVVLSADSWRLRWAGPQELHGMRADIATPSLRGFVAVPEATVEASLWGLLPFSRLRAGKVTVSRPAAEFLRLESVVVPAPAAPAPAAPSPAEPPPGSPSSPAADGPVSLPMADLSGTLVVEQGSLHVSDAASATAVRLTGIACEVALPSLRSPATAKLSAALLRDDAPSGRFSADARIPDPLAWILEDSRAGSGSALVESLDLAALSMLLPAENGAPRIDSGILSGRCEFQADSAEAVSADVAIDVSDLHVAGSPAPAADARCSVSFAWRDGRLAISDGALASPWVSASVAGDLSPSAAGALPTGHLQANINASLPGLARDFGAWAGLREGVEIRQGLLGAGLDLSSDGETTLFQGKASVSGPLVLAFEGDPFELSAPSVEFALREEGADAPIAIDRLSLVTSFGRLDGAGDAAGARFLGSLDLAAFRRDCGRVFQGLPEMAGSVGFDGSLAFRAAGDISAALSAKAEGLSVAVSNAPAFRLDAGELHVSGTMPETHDALADLALRIHVPAGVVSGRFERVSWPTGGEAFSPASLGVKGGVVQGDLDLAGLLSLASPWVRMPETTRLQGRLLPGISVLAQSGKVLVGVDAAIRSFRFEASGLKTPFTEPSARLAANFGWTPAEGALEVSRGTLKSSWGDGDALQAVLSGTGRERMLSASGNVAIDWGRVSKYLADGGLGKVSFAGRSARPFRVSGPLGDGTAGFLARAEGECATHLSSLDAYGLQAAAADVEATFGEGVAHVRYAPAVNGGKADVACDVVFAETPRRVRSSRRLFLLDEVGITQAMLRDLLGYVNPLLTQCRIQSGTMSLSLMPFDIPLDKELIKQASFQAHLEGKNLELAPAGELGTVLEIAKLSGRTLVLDRQEVDVVCEKGRVSTGTHEFRVWRFPIRFGGAVTLGGDVDYAIEVPVSEAVGKDYAKYVEGKVVRVGVVGTVGHPRIDTHSLRAGISKLVSDVLRSTAVQEGQEVLDNLLRTLQEKHGGGR